MPERVSVVIPCRNGEAYLPEAIASAKLAQADEIIVVDDGSEDASAAIAVSAGARLFQQPPLGAAAARNAGVALAVEGYIGFLDADDLWTPGSLACRRRVLDTDPAVAAAYGHVEHFHSPELEPSVRAKLYCPPEALPARLAGSMLFRREVFFAIGGFDEALEIGEMFEFIARFTDAGFLATCVPDLVLSRRLHAHNMMRSGNISRSGYLLSLKTVLDRRRAQATSGSRK